MERQSGSAGSTDFPRPPADAAEHKPGLLDEPEVAVQDKDLHAILMAVLDGMCRCGVRGL